jgi:hypothetical protein
MALAWNDTALSREGVARGGVGSVDSALAGRGMRSVAAQWMAPASPDLEGGVPTS